MIQQSNRFLRQVDLVNTEIFKTPVTCIGAGGTGSFIVLTLAKMGFTNITVWDDDTIEEHNISNQFYQQDQVGVPKIGALLELVQAMDGVEIRPNAQRWQRGKPLEGLVISAVDSMAVRKEIYQACRRNPQVEFIIDPRLGGQQVEIYTVDVSSLESKECYEKSLWDDRDTTPLPCTAQAVMYTALTAAAFVSNQARLALESKPYHNCLIVDMNNANIVQMVHR